jgi:hypothetical protein
MRGRVAAILVIGTIITGIAPSRVDARQPDEIVDPEAYAIYAWLLAPTQIARAGGVLLLQRETTLDGLCNVEQSSTDPAWKAALDDFREANARPRLLPQMLSQSTPYRFIARSEIEADDARLALKYPGRWQRRPESIEFVAVSAVGFNPGRTKALVYVRHRSRGTVLFLERDAGAWVRSPVGSCGWIA